MGACKIYQLRCAHLSRETWLQLLSNYCFVAWNRRALAGKTTC